MCAPDLSFALRIKLTNPDISECVYRYVIALPYQPKSKESIISSAWVRSSESEHRKLAMIKSKNIIFHHILIERSFKPESPNEFLDQKCLLFESCERVTFASQHCTPRIFVLSRSFFHLIMNDSREREREK